MSSSDTTQVHGINNSSGTTISSLTNPSADFQPLQPGDIGINIGD